MSVSKYGRYTAQAQAQAQENLLDSGAKNNAFPFWEGIEVSYQICCYGDIITTTTMCSSCSTTVMQNFKPVDTDIWLSYIILCPHYDITSHLICINLQPRMLSQ